MIEQDRQKRLQRALEGQVDSAISSEFSQVDEEIDGEEMTE